MFKTIQTALSTTAWMFLVLVPIMVGSVIVLNGIAREGVLPNMFFFLIGGGFVLMGILLYKINRL
jgi:hypothetical protein